MIPDHHQSNFPIRHDVVHIETVVAVRIHERVIQPIRADLTGGRNRYSVGGEIREGLRWWRGHINWPQQEIEPRGGIEIIIELDNGRSAPAVIEPDPAGPEHTRAIHGIGPPPFDVP